MQGFGSMDVLCMDKTGTLTNESILLEYYMDVLGNESTRVLDFAFLNSIYIRVSATPLIMQFLRARQCGAQCVLYTIACAVSKNGRDSV